MENFAAGGVAPQKSIVQRRHALAIAMFPISNIDSEADVRGARAVQRRNLYIPIAIESAPPGKSAGGWKHRYSHGRNCRDGKRGAADEHQSLLG
jgi:hypothetical protein